MPDTAEKALPAPVLGRSTHTAGWGVRFRTDATKIPARWETTNKTLALPRMPATGVSGLDLYVRGDAGKWGWLGVGMPRATPATAPLANGLPAGGMREFL